MRCIMYGVKLSLVNNLINRPSSFTEWMFVRIFMGQLGMVCNFFFLIGKLNMHLVSLNPWPYSLSHYMGEGSAR